MDNEVIVVKLVSHRTALLLLLCRCGSALRCWRISWAYPAKTMLLQWCVEDVQCLLFLSLFQMRAKLTIKGTATKEV